MTTKAKIKNTGKSTKLIRLPYKTSFKNVEFKDKHLATGVPDVSLLEVSGKAIAVEELHFKSGLIKFYPIWYTDLLDLLENANYKEPVPVFIDTGPELHTVVLYHPYTVLQDTYDIVYVCNIIPEEE